MFLGIKLVAQPDADRLSWSVDNGPSHTTFRSGDSYLNIQKWLNYPVAYSELTADGLRFGYGGSSSSMIGEYLTGIIHSEGTLTLERDAYCTLPIFAYANDELCVVSDSLQWILKQLPSVSIDKAALAGLLVRPTIDESTLFEGLQLLGESAVLQWSPGSWRYSYSEVSPRERDVSDPKDFKKMLEATLLNYWDAVAGERIACETSGGLDSATLPLTVARLRRPVGMHIASMRFGEGFQTTQDQKIQEIADQTASEVTQIGIDQAHHFPLARFFGDEYRPEVFYQYQEIYSEALDALAAELEKQGTTVVFTGIGGDELFENNLGGEEDGAAPWLPTYLDSSMQDLLDKPKMQRERQLADSAFYAMQARNAVYISHGIWPLSPLSDPELYAFCQQLDVQYRSDKNILRGYHQACGFPESVYHPVQNEHFGRFFEDAVRFQYEKVLEAVEHHSVLVKLGYVDWKELLRTYQTARQKEFAGAELFAIFRTVTAEINLQATSSKLVVD